MFAGVIGVEADVDALAFGEQVIEVIGDGAGAGQGDDGKDKAGCLIEIVPSLDAIGYAIPAVATTPSFMVRRPETAL